MVLLIKRERERKHRERMNANQSVSVVQKKRCTREEEEEKKEIIFLSRGAKMCAPSGASPPPPSCLPIVSKNSPWVTTNPNLINTRERERKRDLNLWHHLTSNSSIFVQ